MKAQIAGRELVISGRTRRHCLILLENGSIKLRARYGFGLKQLGPLRFRFGGTFAHAPCWRASSLIQSPSRQRWKAVRSPRLNADPKLAAVAYDPLQAECVTGKGTFVRTSLSNQAH
jgi:hypothetical protein